MPEVNDAQSRLNPTHVKSILSPCSEEEVRKAIQTAAEAGDSISMAGGRHSMGRQQFGTGTVHLDLRGMDRIVAFDRRNGLIEVEGGIMWPELIGYLHADQDGSETIWAVRQKQTGIDQVSIAGRSPPTSTVGDFDFRRLFRTSSLSGSSTPMDA